MTNLRVQRFTGSNLQAFIDELAALRIEVFRDYPYLYDGTMEYERRYLQTYVRCSQAVVVVAFAGEEVIGASTGIPLQFEEAPFKAPFVAAGYDPTKIFYCAESVLRKPWRGRGLGVQFFSEREAHARELGGFDYYAFCAVERPFHHPLKPAGYQSLDGFWQKRGYRKQPQLQTSLRWKDIDQNTETTKQLAFWLKSADI